ncbi:MAG TPA: amidohydrolase family protein [Myxococcota bacterium]|nr:amidohydrolase family protein [Myxococcota bacterium]
MLIRGCEIDGVPRDVRIAAGRIATIAPALAAAPGEPVREARRGALLPGLNDHHAHLFAAAAALRSVHCGPPHVRDAAALGAALAAAGGDGWLRGVGYHESVAGPLDRRALDRFVPDRPARVQHRSGACWVLNGAAIAQLGLDAGVDAIGVERDAAGRATGRLFRLDAWLRERVPREAVSLRALSQRLARCGVSGVTDAGADNDASTLAAFTAARARGELLQRVRVMGSEALPEASGDVESAELKILLDERALPELSALRDRIARAHHARRAVAIHCVTRAELLFALAALGDAGTIPGDRLEHASVAPPETIPRIRELGLTVVTQPSFIAERGDQYASDVELADRPWLYRARAFLAAGVPLAAGSDAPYSEPDPWRAMRAACRRRSEGGRSLGSAEALTPEEALALFTSPLAEPWAPPPRLAPGAPADLCLLRAPWSHARRELSAALVAVTWRAGAVIWDEACSAAGPCAQREAPARSAPGEASGVEP